MKNIIILMILLIFKTASSYEIDTLIIDMNKFSQTEIPNTLNGGFTEFLLDYINGKNGLWAQEFLNRGFDYNSSKPYNIADEWLEYYESNVDISYSLIFGGYNINGQYLQQFENTSGNGFGGISQKVLITDTVDYTFYVYLKGLQDLVVHLKVFNNDFSELLFENEIGFATQNWTKYELKIPPIVNNNQVNYVIGTYDKGKVEIDEASLMPDNNYFGIRYEYYKLFKEWNIEVLRYPGGWFADSEAAQWENGIGDIDQRESPNLSGGKPQRMDFGTLEYLKICEKLNIEPHITLNYLNGYAIDALNWLEYIKGDTNTFFGKLRNKHGISEAFELDLVEVGNEVWENHLQYAAKFNDFYDSLRVKYPEMEIMISGNNWGGKNYFEEIVNITGNKSYIYTVHPYIFGPVLFDGPVNDEFLAVQAIPEFYLRELYSYKNWIKNNKNADNITIGVSEWWSHYATDDWLLDTNIRNSSIESALANASVFDEYNEIS